MLLRIAPAMRQLYVSPLVLASFAKTLHVVDAWVPIARDECAVLSDVAVAPVAGLSANMTDAAVSFIKSRQRNAFVIASQLPEPSVFLPGVV